VARPAQRYLFSTAEKAKAEDAELYLVKMMYSRFAASKP
jgi:hypothetical protein